MSLFSFTFDELQIFENATKYFKGRKTWIMYDSVPNVLHKNDLKEWTRWNIFKPLWYVMFKVDLIHE